MVEPGEKPEKRATARKSATTKSKGKPAPKADPASLAEIRVATAIIRQEARKIAREVFESEFGSVKKDIAEQKSFSINLLIGVLVGAFFMLLAILGSVWIFMADYQKHYLDTQAKFQDEISELKREIELTRIQCRAI